MKTKESIKLITSLTFIALLAACSGDKKQAVENQEEDKPAKEEKSATSSGDEIKVFENVDPSVKTQINGFLADYFAFNQALIEDNQDGAKAAAKKLSATINKFDMSKLAVEQMDFYHAQLTKLNQGLKGVAASADIEESRVELATLSEAIYALVKAYRPNESELYYQFCPMARNNAGANWLSSTKEIVNPYKIGRAHV